MFNSYHNPFINSESTTSSSTEHWDYLPVEQLSRDMVIQAHEGDKLLVIEHIRWHIDEDGQSVMFVSYKNTKLFDSFFPGNFVKVFGQSLN